MARVTLMMVMVVGVLAGTFTITAGSIDGLVTMDHLNFLKDELGTEVGRLPIWWIYAEPRFDGRYHFVEAGGEGVTCVDDVARAAIVYMLHAEADPSRAAESLAHAKDALRFVVAMQRADGLFYNFVFADGRINRDGITSLPGVNWWTARAMWALAEGVAAFAEQDPAFSAQLEAAYVKAIHRLEHAAGTLRGTDVAGVFLMAVIRYVEGQHALGADGEAIARSIEVAERLGRLLVVSQVTDEAHWYVGMRPSDLGALDRWHAWGNHGFEALAYAGRVLDRPDWIASARLEADHFLANLLAEHGAVAAIDARGGLAGTVELYPQIAYGQSPIVRGMAELYRATEDDTYLALAEDAAGWFFGRNPASTAMYDRETGRGYDGIDGPRQTGGIRDVNGSFQESVTGGVQPLARVNYSSGAESTIESLWALLALASVGGSVSD